MMLYSPAGKIVFFLPFLLFSNAYSETATEIVPSKRGDKENVKISELQGKIAELEKALKEKKKEHKTNRKLTAEHQWDSRGFNSLQFFGYTPLPEKFELVVSVDLDSPIASSESRYDLSNFFLEADLSYKYWQNAGPILEVNDFQGVDNDIYRFGVFYVPKWEALKKYHLFLFTKFLFVESDERGGQLSFAWNKRFPSMLNGRFSLGGFVDVNYDSGSTHSETNVVSDLQLRYRVYDELHFITELRYNEFKPSDDEFGVGIGLKFYF